MDSEFIRVAGGRMQEIWHPKPGSDRVVADKIGDIALRLQAEDYLTMPAISYNRIPVELPPPARKAYKAISDDLVAKVDAKVSLTAATAAAAVMKLRQITNGWASRCGWRVGPHARRQGRRPGRAGGRDAGHAAAGGGGLPARGAAIRAALAKVLPAGTEVPYLGGGCQPAGG
jgi:hypothetical protein